MNRIRVATPSRLHFGLLSWGPQSPRQFGGVGLMVDAPGIELTVEPSSDWHAEGPLASRALEVAGRVSAHLGAAGTPIGPARIQVVRAPQEHAGLGVGTQLSLAVARGLAALAEIPEPSISLLAGLSGRGLRSGIGLHGFAHGGLIVDGGRRESAGIPPLLAHLDFPPEWSILIVLPSQFSGLHGRDELIAFAQLPPIPGPVTDRLCRLILLGLLPAVVERDLTTFGASLTELQESVGGCFAPAQGGTFARPELAAIVADLRAQGLHGAGQSSWGPALYAFSDDEDGRVAVLERLRDRFGLDEDCAFWTKASVRGAFVEPPRT